MEMKKLFELLASVQHTCVCGGDIEINHIAIDSRKVEQGDLFVCIKGIQQDGHLYIESAIKNGAKAILVEQEIGNIEEGITVIKVPNTRAVLDEIVSRFYDYPAKSMRMIGVTGTNGKTSVTYFMEQLLVEYGRIAGVIGTVEQRVDKRKLDIEITTSTTPDVIELQYILSTMKKEKADDVVIEVTSHALSLNRVDSIDFEIGIFTNLTQDHLDFHGTMENYAKAKSKLFTMCKYGVLNVDSEWVDHMLQDSTCEVITYSIEKESDFQAKNIVYSNEGVSFELFIDGSNEKFQIGIPGKFSLYNALAVVGASVQLGIPVEIIRKGLKNIQGVPGRIDRVPSDKNFDVFVDYAHTPDGLKNIIEAVKEFTKGRVIIVFGCGGDRDKTKRPIMGKVCATLADYVIVTSDNPRTENPSSIIEDIVVGVESVCEYKAIVDRKDAIYYAVSIAQENDSIIIAGKGHEDYQIFAEKTIHFDDREVAQQALKSE